MQREGSCSHPQQGGRLGIRALNLTLHLREHLLAAALRCAAGSASSWRTSGLPHAFLRKSMPQGGISPPQSACREDGNKGDTRHRGRGQGIRAGGRLRAARQNLAQTLRGKRERAPGPEGLPLKALISESGWAQGFMTKRASFQDTASDGNAASGSDEGG